MFPLNRSTSYVRQNLSPLGPIPGLTPMASTTDFHLALDAAARKLMPCELAANTSDALRSALASLGIEPDAGHVWRCSPGGAGPRMKVTRLYAASLIVGGANALSLAIAAADYFRDVLPSKRCTTPTPFSKALRRGIDAHCRPAFQAVGQETWGDVKTKQELAQLVPTASITGVDPRRWADKLTLDLAPALAVLAAGGSVADAAKALDLVWTMAKIASTPAPLRSQQSAYEAYLALTTQSDPTHPSAQPRSVHTAPALDVPSPRLSLSPPQRVPLAILPEQQIAEIKSTQHLPAVLPASRAISPQDVEAEQSLPVAVLIPETSLRRSPSPPIGFFTAGMQLHISRSQMAWLQQPVCPAGSEGVQESLSLNGVPCIISRGDLFALLSDV